MDYFDELDKKQAEQNDKELFEEKYLKQYKVTKKILLITFGIIGVIFLVLGIVFISLGIVDEEDGFPVGWIFIGLGAFYGLIGLIAGLVNSKPNYAKFKERVSKYGGTNIYDLSIRIDMLEAKIKSLEEEIKNKKD